MFKPIAVVTLAVALAGCNSSSDNSKQQNLNSLQANQAKWQKTNTNKYSVELDYAAHSPNSGSYLYIVSDNKIDKLYNLTGQKYEAKDTHQGYETFTIDGLFDYAESAINQAETFEVDYHPVSGYPTHITADYDKSKTDDDIAIKVNKLHRENDPSVMCDMQAVPGIEVTLSTEDVLLQDMCSAKVVITDGDYSETLSTCENNVYQGAFERPGSYSVKAGKAGYQESVLNNVDVAKDLCHVRTRNIKLDLVAETKIASTEAINRLNINKAKWSALDEQHYYIALNYSAFSLYAGTFSTLVKDEKISDLFNSHRQFYVEDKQHIGFEQFTVGGLFALAEDAINKAEDFTVEYHQEYGYPTKINADYALLAADDEFFLEVTELQTANGTACTEDYRAGVIINLSAQDNTEADLCSAQITLTDGDYTETLTEYCYDNSFSGAYERAGKYQIEIAHKGYQSKTINNLHLAQDICHVHTREIEVQLVPGS